jgi:hypothetical protein
LGISTRLYCARDNACFASIRPAHNHDIRRGDRIALRYDSSGLKKGIYLLIALGLFVACEQKTTTVNPPADKKESNTTIVNPPSQTKESHTTVINPPGQKENSTTKEEKTDININTSPSP